MGRKDKIKRKSGAGAFFGGTFFGFLLGIGAIVGICAFAYFKVSPQWINDTFDANINLGNEEINNKTLNDVVQTVISISNSTDTYSINSLKEDFGVELPDELMGINIEDLKAVPLNDLADAFQNKLSNISAEELKNLFSSESLNNIMGKTVKYYYNVSDGKLYKDLADANSVAKFDYKIQGNTVVIKTFEPINFNANNSVDITLKYLPLTVAIDDFAGNLGDNITLGELHNEYGVDLPDYIYNGNEDKKINEIEGLIEEIYVADFLGYTIQSGRVMNGTEEVTGIIGIIAQKKVSQLTDIQSTIEAQTIATLLDYTISGGVVKDKSGNTVTGLLAKIAPYSILNVDSVINDLTLSDVFTSTQLNSGILSLIDANTKVVNIENSVKNVITTTSINVLISDNINVIDVSNLSTEEKAKLNKVIPFDIDGDGTVEAGETTTLGALSLQQFIEFCLTNLPV